MRASEKMTRESAVGDEAVMRTACGWNPMLEDREQIAVETRTALQRNHIHEREESEAQGKTEPCRQANDGFWCY